ncbi:MAG: vgr related protein [Phycisphaerales bacterium]|nr:vgr related protein [Hyphomonadaceae bacterium]
MPTWARRPLTEGEVALGKSVFGGEIDWRAVRVLQAPPELGFGAMVPRARTIVFSRWRAVEDFAHAPLSEQGWFVHELMHVWQAARGVFLAGAKLNALGKGAYFYTSRPGARLKHYNIERQAEIARHLFLARNGAAEPGMPAPEWLEEIWETR